MADARQLAGRMMEALKKRRAQEMESAYAELFAPGAEPEQVSSLYKTLRDPGTSRLINNGNWTFKEVRVAKELGPGSFECQITVEISRQESRRIYAIRLARVAGEVRILSDEFRPSR
jgi:hypothetical protein